MFHKILVKIYLIKVPIVYRKLVKISSQENFREKTQKKVAVG
jgi:hypothetical protein